MDFKGKHILIVDDSTNNLRYTAKILRTNGYKTSLASNANDALKLIENHVPDVILLDIIMPNINGLELCEIIKSNPNYKEVPIVFLTSRSGTTDIVQGFRAGGADYLTKPFQTEELLVRIKNQLKIAHLTKELLKTSKDLKEKQEKLFEDLLAAGNIQRSLLPPDNIKFPCIDIAWEFKPCESVGGDIFNVLELKKNQYAFYMVDVSGHGVPSSLIAVAVTQALQLASGLVFNHDSGKVNSPAYVLDRLNKQFPFERFDKFFTIIYGCIDCCKGEFTYSHAGHPLGFVLKNFTEIKQLNVGGSLIGVSDKPFKEEKIMLNKGDKIIFYTDGITEHQSDDGTMYTENRLKEKFLELAMFPLDSIFDYLYKDVIEFGGDVKPKDDMTMLGIEFIPKKKDC